jgi:hypothetical protein
VRIVYPQPLGRRKQRRKERIKYDRIARKAEFARTRVEELALTTEEDSRT